MDSIQLLFLIAAVFSLAGLVKGVIGLGLPTVALSLMTVSTDLTTAMSLMLAPTLATNILQAFGRRGTLRLIGRLCPFLLPAMAMVGLGGLILQNADLKLLTGLLGVVLILYAVSGLTGFVLHVSEHREAPLGFCFGAVNGVLTGMVGSYAVPGVMFLQGLNLPRDAFVQAMGLLFLGSTLALGVTLSGANILDVEAGGLSVLACVPAFAGFFAGQAIRKRLSERLFRRLFFLGLLALGLFVSIRSFGAL
ncbi:sulfite exporter TauE/SafE family protein [Roseibium litorale]|uniref:Probable membrane transporter protein n=1 Tax=Roseibium litorale TaxID=2803841 RepID=A0ABR9CPQ4_9HYPH|nr:TSUP family transporter [Roseibium litorale]MBD8892830.1 sulfite exporter TauE/SafE family protein [Roseibium litorale]